MVIDLTGNHNIVIINAHTYKYMHYIHDIDIECMLASLLVPFVLQSP